jgi:hypothetical protein
MVFKMVHIINKSWNPADWFARDVERIRRMSKSNGEEKVEEEEYSDKKEYKFPMGE